jgi:hypothetical protein
VIEIYDFFFLEFRCIRAAALQCGRETNGQSDLLLSDSRGKACTLPPFLASSCMANEMLARFRHCRNAKLRTRAFDFCNNEPFQLLLFCCVCVFIFPTSPVAGDKKCDTTVTGYP